MLGRDRWISGRICPRPWISRIPRRGESMERGRSLTWTSCTQGRIRFRSSKGSEPTPIGGRGSRVHVRPEPKRGAERSRARCPKRRGERSGRDRVGSASKSAEIAPARRVGSPLTSEPLSVLCVTDLMDEKLVRFVLAHRNCFGRSQGALAGCGNRATAAAHYCALCIETMPGGTGKLRLGAPLVWFGLCFALLMGEQANTMTGLCVRSLRCNSTFGR